jgi:hypothetical protein
MDTQNGAAGSGKCHCLGNSRFALDLYARSFAGEIARGDVVVLDTNGNVITRIGRYGNVEDGRPLVAQGRASPPADRSEQSDPSDRSDRSDEKGSDPFSGVRSLGGDEVSLLSPRFVAAHSDCRLFIGDRGNERILSVRLDYHTSERIRLKDAPQTGP